MLSVVGCTLVMVGWYLTSQEKESPGLLGLDPRLRTVIVRGPWTNPEAEGGIIGTRRYNGSPEPGTEPICSNAEGETSPEVPSGKDAVTV